MFGQWVADGAQGGHFGHAPYVHHPGIEIFFEALYHCARRGGAADHHAVELQFVARLETSLLDVLLQHHPYGGHAQRQGHAFITHQLIEACTIQRRPWQNQLGATQSTGVWHAPGVDVEHGHYH
ncbi:hypothetical protein D3C84_1030480 [compost metagenome]